MYRLRKDLDIYLLKCETFTETFELVSELRACEASLLIDITTQYMLKHVEQNQVGRFIIINQATSDKALLMRGIVTTKYDHVVLSLQ